MLTLGIEDTVEGEIRISSRNWGARLGSSSLGSLGWIDGMNWGGR